VSEIIEISSWSNRDHTPSDSHFWVKNHMKSCYAVLSIFICWYLKYVFMRSDDRNRISNIKYNRSARSLRSSLYWARHLRISW